MNGIEQIRESRKDGYWGLPVDGYECLEAERHVDYLLAQVDRLQAIADTAREIVADAIADDELVNWAVVILQSALAAYDAAEGE